MQSGAAHTIHHLHHSCDEVADVLKRSGLMAIAVNGKWLAKECLSHEIADYTPIVQRHARTCATHGEPLFEQTACLRQHAFADLLTIGKQSYHMC